MKIQTTFLASLTVLCCLNLGCTSQDKEPNSTFDDINFDNLAATGAGEPKKRGNSPVAGSSSTPLSWMGDTWTDSDETPGFYSDNPKKVSFKGIQYWKYTFQSSSPVAYVLQNPLRKGSPIRAYNSAHKEIGLSEYASQHEEGHTYNFGKLSLNIIIKGKWAEIFRYKKLNY